MEAGIYHGVRAAGYEDEREHPLQVSSIQTEASKVIKRGQWKLHNAALVLVDEGHLHTNPQSQSVLTRHLEEGAAIVYVTATPIGMRDVCDQLVQAGTTSQTAGRWFWPTTSGRTSPTSRHSRSARVRT